VNKRRCGRRWLWYIFRFHSRIRLARQIIQQLDSSSNRVYPEYKFRVS